jgi:hypothetical protein
MTRTGWVSTAVLAVATLLKVIYTVLGSSESLQTGTFVGLAVFVLLLPKPQKEEEEE